MGTMSIVINVAGSYTFYLQIDGVNTDSISCYVDTAGVDFVLPCMFHVNTPLSIGSHTIGIYIPANTIAHSVNCMSMIIQETISATVLASTGATGPIGPTGPSSSYSGTGGASQWGNNGSNIYFNSGNVAIGKTTPSYTLDVSGNINAASFFANSDYRIKKDIKDLDYNIDTGATGASGLGCKIVNTQLFDNVVAVNSSSYSGSGIPTNWTKSYTSIGGNLLIFCNFSC